jgi:hypothetical protein
VEEEMEKLEKGKKNIQSVSITHGLKDTFFVDGRLYCTAGHQVIDLVGQHQYMLKDGVVLLVDNNPRLINIKGVGDLLDLGWVKLEGPKDWKGEPLPELREIALGGRAFWLWAPTAQRWLFVVSRETFDRCGKEVKKYLLTFAPERGIIGISLTLGGDPEFEAYVDGRIVPAIEVPIFREGGFRGEIGLDEYNEIAELRPAYGYSPEEYLSNFLTLVERVRAEGILLSVKGDTFPLGGHIHIGSPNKKVSTILRMEEEAFVKVLDDYVGRVLRPTSGKARTGWGALGASCWEEYGLQYCTPPSSYYADPEMVRITYKLVKNLVEFLLIEEELTYEVLDNGRAKPEEYLRFLSKEETEYFLSFPEKWARGEIVPFVPMGSPAVLVAAG